MDEDLQTLNAVLARAEQQLAQGSAPSARCYPTGFDPLDTYLGGGLRGGELTLVGGGAGLGKTTLVLQMARNVVALGDRALVFSFEHDGQSLLERLLSIEIAECGHDLGVPLRSIRDAMRTEDASRDLPARLGDTAPVTAGLAAVRAYGDRLLLHAPTRGTGLDTIREVVGRVLAADGPPPLVIVDYLQKVHDRRQGTEEDRVAAVVEDLKDLALETGAPVLAVVAAGFDGIKAGTRLRLHHLRGSSALAYEPDLVLLMNDKYDAVAHDALVYDSGNADRFHEHVVVTIEKNRTGLDRIDLEFRKRFDEGRFERHGQKVREKLVDSRIGPAQ